MSRAEAKARATWLWRFPLWPWNLYRDEQVFLMMSVMIGISVWRVWRRVHE
jgi:hypothetical protein